MYVCMYVRMYVCIHQHGRKAKQKKRREEKRKEWSIHIYRIRCGNTPNSVTRLSTENRRITTAYKN